MAFRVFALILVLSVVSIAASPLLHATHSSKSAAANLDLTRSVPLDIGEAKLPHSYSTANEAFCDLQYYQKNKNYFVIMEITRRAQLGLNPAEAHAFLELVKGQYQKQFDDPVLYFEQGYAQYVMRRNPTGLMLIQAADKQIHSPATALAVAMAQIENQNETVLKGRFKEAWERQNQLMKHVDSSYLRSPASESRP